jgi:hypothetical protein
MAQQIRPRKQGVVTQSQRQGRNARDPKRNNFQRQRDFEKDQLLQMQATRPRN